MKKIIPSEKGTVTIRDNSANDAVQVYYFYYAE